MANTTYYATYATIEKETEKAILHSEFGWMPKSQIRKFNSPMGQMVAMPAWLKMQKSRSNYRYGRICWWAVTEKEIQDNQQ